jgi:hypothetical protein
MLNAFDNTLFILISLSILFLLYFLFNLFEHYKFLNTDTDILEVDDNYKSVDVAVKTYESLLKFAIRRFVKGYYFIIHYMHLLSIKVLASIQSLFDYLYSVLRNSFVKKSVKNKVYVKHFWNNLKEFKKEMDEDELVK